MQTDRTKTPWLIVISHAPWYNSYTKHYKEVECFRKAYEPLLLKYQVDVMIHGHVHAYERTKPVAEYMVGSNVAAAFQQLDTLKTHLVWLTTFP